MTQGLEDYLKLWEDEQPDQDGNKPEKLSEEATQLKLEMPLKEGLLKLNLGIPVIFLISKSDIVVSNERKRFEEDSEFIFKHIRKLALACTNILLIYYSDGATTIYTSTKTNINIQIIYEYLLHRLYKFDFLAKPNIIDKESYFIPSGYDSLSILKSYDAQNDLDKIFSERINSTKQSAKSIEEEISCEDSQMFLRKFYGAGGSNNKPKAIEIKNPTDSTTPSNATSSISQQAGQPSILRNTAGTTSASKLDKYGRDYATTTQIKKEPSSSEFTSKYMTEDKQKNLEKIKSMEKLELSKAEPKPEKLSASDQLKLRLAHLKNNK